jgi:hypothetical protein
MERGHLQFGAPFGAPPPLYLFGRPFLTVHKTRTRITRRENGILFSPLPARGEKEEQAGACGGCAVHRSPA